MQGVINKLATMVATFIVAKYLSPDDFAMSALALGLGGGGGPRIAAARGHERCGHYI